MNFFIVFHYYHFRTDQLIFFLGGIEKPHISQNQNLFLTYELTSGVLLPTAIVVPKRLLSDRRFLRGAVVVAL